MNDNISNKLDDRKEEKSRKLDTINQSKMKQNLNGSSISSIDFEKKRA